MGEYHEAPDKYAWMVYAVAAGLFGLIAGYVIAADRGAGRSIAPAAPAPAAVPASAPIVDESKLRAYRDILARDPRNLEAAVKAGNLLYGAQPDREAGGVVPGAGRGQVSARASADRLPEIRHGRNGPAANRGFFEQIPAVCRVLTDEGSGGRT